MKNKYILLSTAILLLFTPAAIGQNQTDFQPLQSFGPKSASCYMGSNLSGYKGWPTQLIFVNLAHHAIDWFPLGTIDWNVRLDRSKLTKDGLKAGETGQLAIFWDMTPQVFTDGKYVLTYKGTGNVKVDSRNIDIQIITQQKGRIEMNLTKKTADLFLFFHVLSNDVNDNIREIRLTEAALENSTQVYRTEFLNDHIKYGTFRFMDWMGTNTSPIKTWSDYTTEKSGFQRVTAFSHMIRLCNQLKADAWFCVPHQADDDFITQMATKIKNELDPALKVYVEYTNEAWNGMFGKHDNNGNPLESGQFTYMYIKAKQYYPGDPDEHNAARRYFTRRTGEAHKIFDQVFGTQKTRLVRVLGGFVGNTWLNNNILEHYKTLFGKNPDALAIAPYFGNELSMSKYTSTIATWTLNEVFKHLKYGNVLSTTKGSLIEAKERIQANKVIADKWGVTLLAYEGGQHLTSTAHETAKDQLTKLFTDANRDKRMYDLYIEYFNTWKQESGGGLFCNFADIGNYSVFGSWGAKEFGWQTKNDAPKFGAIMDWIDKNCSATTSVENKLFSPEEFSVYPNPVATDRFTVFNSFSETMNVILYDALGKSVHTQKIITGENSIITNDLPEGIYYLNGRTPSGKVVNAKVLRLAE